MQRPLPAFLILLTTLLSLASGPAAHADPGATTVPVPGADALAIGIPAAWKKEMEKSSHDAPPTITLTTPSGLKVSLTLMSDAEGKFATPDAVDELVTIANQHYIDNAVEKDPKLVHLTPKVGHGSYSTFTEARLVGVASPAPGDFRNVTSGVYVIGHDAVIFTILSNDTVSAEFRQAMDLISSGISVAAGGS